jgi:hypothetical protein
MTVLTPDRRPRRYDLRLPRVKRRLTPEFAPGRVRGASAARPNPGRFTGSPPLRAA